MLKVCFNLLRVVYWALRSSHIRALMIAEADELISRRKIKGQRRAERKAAWKAAGREL